MTLLIAKYDDSLPAIDGVPKQRINAIEGQNPLPRASLVWTPEPHAVTDRPVNAGHPPVVISRPGNPRSRITEPVLGRHLGSIEIDTGPQKVDHSLTGRATQLNLRRALSAMVSPFMAVVTVSITADAQRESACFAALSTLQPAMEDPSEATVAGIETFLERIADICED